MQTPQYLIWVKHASDQKVESSRAPSLSKSNNKVYNNSLLNMKHTEFSTEWFSPQYLFFQPPLQSPTNNPFLYSSKCSPPNLFTKFPTIPTNTAFLYSIYQLFFIAPVVTDARLHVHASTNASKHAY